jgi:hypothetical protein
MPGPRWLIDVGGDGPRLGALVRPEPGADWSPLVVRVSGNRTVISRSQRKRLLAA